MKHQLCLKELLVAYLKRLKTVDNAWRSQILTMLQMVENERRLRDVTFFWRDCLDFSIFVSQTNAERQKREREENKSDNSTEDIKNAHGWSVVWRNWLYDVASVSSYIRIHINNIGSTQEQ